MSRKKGPKRPNKAPAPAEAPAEEPSRLALPAAGARTLVGLIFLASGLLKAAAPAQEFAFVIADYRILPGGMLMPAATLLPGVEIILGLSLISGFLSRAASAAAGAFSLTFFLALGSTALRGIELIDCGCLGGGFHPTRPQAMGLDAALICLSYAAYRWGKGLAPLDAWIERGSSG